MSIRALTTCCLAIALLLPGSATRLDAQGREREKSEARAQELRQRANQTEEKIARYMSQRKEINAALENTNREETPDRFEQLMANRKELDAAIANIRRQFVAARERNQEGERSRRRDRGRAQKEGQGRANQIERKLKQHLAQLKEIIEINAWLERNQGEAGVADKREQLIGQRKELMAAVETIKVESAGRRERNRERERNQPRKRDRERDVHPEIRSAVNSLEHLEHAHGHLMEAGMTEIAHMVEQRMNNFRKKIEGYRQNPKREAKDRPEKKKRDGERREDRRKGGGNEREVAAAQIKVMKTALMALREGEHKDSAELLNRAIQARAIRLRGAEGKQAKAILEREPNPGQTIEVLGLATKLWREFGNQENTAAVRELAGQLAASREGGKKQQPRSKAGLKRLNQLEDEVAELEAALDKRLGQLQELKRKIDR